MDLEQEIKTVLGYEKSKKQWRNEHSSKEFKAAAALGVKINSPLNRSRNCNCIEDLFIVMKILTRNNNKLKSLEMKKDSKFRIKGNKMIMVHGHTPLTNDNLTDEAALALLKTHPRTIGQFEEYPKDWEKLAGVKKKKAAVAIEVEADVKVVNKTPEATKEASEAVSEETGTQTREEELNEAEVTVLRALADALFNNNKAEKKAHFKAGKEKLVAYILENE